MSTTDIIGRGIGLLSCFAIVALVWFAPILKMVTSGVGRNSSN